jgi:hypothetical protein
MLTICMNSNHHHAVATRRRLKKLADEAAEDAGTARLVAQAEIAGGMPLLPKAIVDRFASGDNPKRFARKLGVPLDLLASIAVSDEEPGPVRLASRKRTAPETVRQRKRR